MSKSRILTGSTLVLLASLVGSTGCTLMSAVDRDSIPSEGDTSDSGSGQGDGSTTDAKPDHERDSEAGGDANPDAPDTSPDGDGGPDATDHDGAPDATDEPSDLDAGDEPTDTDGGDQDATTDAADEQTGPDGGDQDAEGDASDDATQPDGGEDDAATDAGDDAAQSDGGEDDAATDAADDQQAADAGEQDAAPDATGDGGEACTSSYDCTGPASSACDDTTGTCRPCQSNGECMNGGWGTVCAAGVCTCSDDTECTNLRAPRCIDDGTDQRCGCGTGAACATGELCTGKTDAAVCKVAPGFTCTGDPECASGMCTGGTCTKLDVGALCGQDGDCASGSCAGGTCEAVDLCAGVTCTAQDQCHDAGVCNPATGNCSNPKKPDGAACNDGDALTKNDVCTDGACAGVSLCADVTCAPLDDCHEVGTCDSTTGVCSNPIKSDGNECTDDLCDAGVESHPAREGAACDQNKGVCNDTGACVPLPEVAGTSPADGALVLTSATIAVTFTQAMNPATLVGQTVAGDCDGTIQVSLDDFASCIAFTSGTASMSVGNDTATLTPATALAAGTTYKVRVTTSAKSALGAAMAQALTTPNGFATAPDVVISQVYGGGGGTTGSPAYKCDYVVLHNKGLETASLTGMSLQYASSTGKTWSVSPAVLSGTIAAGGYYLVQLGTAKDALGGDLVGVDAVMSGNAALSLAAASGKITLVTDSSKITDGACPDASRVVDFVGYGDVNCSAGSATGATGTGKLSTTSAAIRNGSGCANTNNNAADFTVTTPVPAPMNSASDPVICN